LQHLPQPKTSINDTERTVKTVKIDNYSFTNSNSKGGFKEINSTSDLKELHNIGIESAKKVFAIMND
jgi:hypothetical protein